MGACANPSLHTVGPTVGADQFPSTPPSDPLYSLRPASTDKWPFQDSRSDERLLDPSAPSQGTTMWPEILQWDRSPDLSKPGENEATANFVLHTYDSLSLGPPSQQFQHRINASQRLGTSEYPYFGQPQTIYPFLADNISLDDSQQSTSLPQSSLGPHPQSQELIELDLLYPPFPATTSLGPPAEVATTSHCREPVDESEPQVTNRPPSSVRGITLERPQPADGETVVQLRRDTCITLSFDMRSLSKELGTYDGLKIPSTCSVRSHCNEGEKKPLHLEIHVLGATTKKEYETLCHVCKAREGLRDAFPDFRATSNILDPKRNGKVLVSFTLACNSKHREPQDSEYRLKVILNGGAEQNNPLIEYELPYFFNIVTKLPSQTRNQGEEVETVGDAAPPPNKRRRTRSGHAGHVGNPASQGIISSGPDELSSGDPRGPTNSIPSDTSENPVPPMDNRHPVSPAEALFQSHQCRQTVNTVGDEETADGRNSVIERINPSKGPTAGGAEIWILGSNFPTGRIPLYVRFGDNFAHAVAHRPDLLSCLLPQANVPGTVPVWLSRSPDLNAPVLGTSLCQFEYFTDINQMLPVIIRIQEDCTPEVAAALDILHKEMKKRNLKTKGKRPLRGGETQHDEIETAIIQALAPHQNTPDFGTLISKTNDYKQTLAHFAVLFGYANLLKRLVGWNIDFTIADVNGFTALHCAYKKGDRVCVDLLLEKGASETVLDALGRAPSHLMPKGFALLNDHNANVTSDGHPESELTLDTPSLVQSTDSRHVVSDSGDEKAIIKASLADLIQRSQSSSAARNHHNIDVSISGTSVVDGRNDARLIICSSGDGMYRGKSRSSLENPLVSNGEPQKTSVIVPFPANQVTCQRSQPRNIVGRWQTSWDRPVKNPPVEYEPDPIKLQTLCRQRGGMDFACEWILKVFDGGVTLEALLRRLKLSEIESMNFHGGFTPRLAYDGFLQTIGDRFECCLCVMDERVWWKHKKDAVRHLRKFHFGIADRCIDCNKSLFSIGEMNKHQCPATLTTVMGPGASSDSPVNSSRN